MRFLFSFFIIFVLFSCKNNVADTVITDQHQQSERQITTNEPITKNIEADEAKKMLESNPDIMVLDVSTPEETNQGILQKAIIIDIYDPGFNAKIDQLDKEKTYIVYCAAGGRSATACQIMTEKGFKKLYNLSGGYRAWNK